MPDPTPPIVTIIQDAQGRPVAVRYGETEIPVMTAAPIAVTGMMAVSLTIAPAHVEVEQRAP